MLLPVDGATAWSKVDLQVLVATDIFYTNMTLAAVLQHL